MERNVLVLIVVPIPFFGFVYLNSQNPIFYFDVPQLSGFWECFSLGVLFTLLLAQYFLYQQNVKRISNSSLNLHEKMELFSNASFKRYGLLFLASLLASLGLFLFSNTTFTFGFAISLLFFSIAKPTPDRIIRALRLKGEEKELVIGLKRRV
jgi:hypothetical protein